MTAHKFNSLCKQTEPYYYDFLCRESHEPIPETVVNHIEQCQYCQEQVHRLEAILSQYEDIEPAESQSWGAIIAILKLHFAYIGKDVTCESVRPFLPTLLDPDLEVKIPTPITVHIDRCQQCAQDLETIRNLNLSREQLCRLSKLFAAKPDEDSVSCSQAHHAVMAFVSLTFSKTNEQVLKHLSACSYCRKVVYKYRETVRTEYLHEKGRQKCSICDQVSVTDIFDYVVPYGLDPAHDQYAKFRGTLTSHLCSCPACLAKIQQLHETVYGIIERAESEIVTTYYLDESVKTISQSDELYNEFPIKVEVSDSQGKAEVISLTPIVSFADSSKEKVSAPKKKQFIKTGIAAAAAVLIVSALLFILNMPTAQAVTIDQVYKAIEKVKNVYISKFAAGNAKPAEEKWISRPLNIYMAKTRKELVFWDINNKVRKIKQLDNNITETILLSNDMLADVDRKITGSLGLMPFNDMSEIPPGAAWSRIADEDVKVTFRGAEVYDLTWVEKNYGGSAVFRRWRVFVNAETNLPQRAEWYQKLTADDEFVLTAIITVEYLSEDEIQDVIKKASF